MWDMLVAFRHYSVLSLLALAACGAETAPVLAPQAPDARKTADVPPILKGDLFLTRVSLDRQNDAGFKPRKNLAAYPLTLPIDWAADPYTDENWRFQLNAWRMLDPYMAAWFESGDAVHLEQAMEFVRDWYGFHIKSRTGNSFAWYDMSTGLRGQHIALLENARLRGDLNLNVEDAEMLADLARLHIRQTRRDGITASNHGLFQLAGVSLLCRSFPEDRACRTMDDYIRREFSTLMAGQFTPEGVHKEHSPDYHMFMMRAIERMGALQPYFIDVDMDIVADVAPWLVFPNGQNARIGDSEKTGNPLAKDPDPTCLPDAQCFAVGDFTTSGYAVIRDLPSGSPDSMLFVTGMAHSGVHRHADALSFELYEAGRFVFIDGGKYGYDDTAKRRYVLTSDAHNTIGLNTGPIAPRFYEEPGSYLNPIKTTSDGFQISGKVDVEDHFLLSREITYMPGQSLRIKDSLTAEKRQPYVSQLLLAPDLTPQAMPNGFRVDLGTQVLTAQLESENCRINIVRGQVSPYLGWHSPSYQVMDPASAIRAICPGKAREITWDIKLSPPS